MDATFAFVAFYDFLSNRLVKFYVYTNTRHIHHINGVKIVILRREIAIQKIGGKRNKKK